MTYEKPCIAGLLLFTIFSFMIINKLLESSLFPTPV